MDETSMIERVARALALADLDDETAAIVDLDAHMKFVRPHYSGLARAAIEAMRGPTEAMAQEGLENVYTNSPTEIYNAMIDAALSQAIGDAK